MLVSVSGRSLGVLGVLPCVAVCCSMLQSAAVCCIVTYGNFLKTLSQKTAPDCLTPGPPSKGGGGLSPFGMPRTGISVRGHRDWGVVPSQFYNLNRDAVVTTRTLTVSTENTSQSR